MITSVAASEEVKAQDVNPQHNCGIVIYSVSQKVETRHKFFGTRHHRG